MTPDEASLVSEKIDYEGFDYAMRSYSNWREIKDKEFHRLLKQYCRAADDLEEYLSEAVSAPQDNKGGGG